MSHHCHSIDFIVREAQRHPLVFWISDILPKVLNDRPFECLFLEKVCFERAKLGERFASRQDQLDPSTWPNVRSVLGARKTIASAGEIRIVKEFRNQS